MKLSKVIDSNTGLCVELDISIDEPQAILTKVNQLTDLSKRHAELINQSKCPSCNLVGLIPLSSLHKKYCNGCQVYFDWELEDGQQYLVSNNRIKNKSSCIGAREVNGADCKSVI